MLGCWVPLTMPPTFNSKNQVQHNEHNYMPNMALIPFLTIILSINIITCKRNKVDKKPLNINTQHLRGQHKTGKKHHNRSITTKTSQVR